MKLAGKTVLVVGAGGGIGLELVRQLLGMGCGVIAFSRKVEEVWASTPEADRRGLTVCAGDVRQAGDVERLFARLQGLPRPVDGVIYCAGVSRPDLVEIPEVERALDTLRVNLEGAFRIFYGALPLLRARPEAFIAGISSMAGDRCLPRAHSYCASKAGLNRLLEGLRIDLWDTNIRVFTLVPAYIESPMTRQNRVPMPGIWPLERGVRFMLRGIERGEAVLRFPWYYALVMKLVVHLPGWLYGSLMSRMRTQVKVDPRSEDGFCWPTDI